MWSTEHPPLIQALWQSKNLIEPFTGTEVDTVSKNVLTPDSASVSGHGSWSAQAMEPSLKDFDGKRLLWTKCLLSKQVAQSRILKSARLLFHDHLPAAHLLQAVSLVWMSAAGCAGFHGTLCLWHLWHTWASAANAALSVEQCVMPPNCPSPPGTPE